MNCAQFAGMRQDDLREESDYASTYETEGSMSDRDMDIHPPVTGEHMLEGMKGIVSSIGDVDAVTAAIVEKLESLGSAISTVQIVEKLESLGRAISTVQFDMTWMRDDMRGVLGGMEKLRENVCEMRGAHMEVERLREQISLYECTGQTYKSGASAAMQGGATAEGAKQGNPNHHHHDEVGLKDVHTVAECSILETQLHNMEADNAIHNLSSTEEGVETTGLTRRRRQQDCPHLHVHKHGQLERWTQLTTRKHSINICALVPRCVHRGLPDPCGLSSLQPSAKCQRQLEQGLNEVKAGWAQSVRGSPELKKQN